MTRYQHLRSAEEDPDDPVSAKQLNKQRIEGKLKERGIEVLELSQVWRHVHGKVVVDGEVLFFKLASTRGISRATRNEVRWNRFVSRSLSKRSAFTVPKILTTGIIDNKFFYTADFIEAKPLCNSARRASTKRLKAKLGLFSRSFSELNEIRGGSFVWDRRYKGLKYPGKKFSRRASSFYRSVGELTELVPVLDVALQVEQTYRPGLAHGDLTPWHMLVNKDGRLVLTDAEWGTGNLPRYYDLAYCYHRLCTCVGGFGLAADIVTRFRRELSPSERRYFDRAFRPILAERVTGGYWDALKGENTATGHLTYHRRLRKLLLANDLY